jgi:SnoaL-like domain
MSVLSDRFRDAVLAGDHPAMVGALAPGVVFNSPVAFLPFEGRDAVGQVLGAVMETFEDFRYTDELAGETAHALVFKARVGPKEVEGIDLLRFDDDGQIRDFTVLVRPLSATIALAEAMGPKVAHLKGGSGRSAA